jgi:TolB protein
VRTPLLNCFVALLASSLVTGAIAQPLEIEIREGSAGAMPIAVVPFDQVSAGPGGEDVASIVASDLHLSGRFAPLPVQGMGSRPHDASQVDFDEWRAAGAEAVVVGRVQQLSPERLEVQFQLLDVPKGEQLLGFRITSERGGLRRTAHHVSDMIYKALTGQRGAFATQIAYVTVTRGLEGTRYSLKIADADGYGPQTILSSPEPVMSPAWSPDGRRIAYVSFETKRPEIFIQDVATGSRESVASFEGINGAPAWSPDGRKLAMTLSKGSNPDIYVLNLSTRAFTRLTEHYAIDTEPTWSPDARYIVFTSDRGGRPQLYRISAAGGNAERLTYEGDYNARAALSPDGTQLAMVNGAGGRYRIAVQDLDTRLFQELSRGPLDESPSFAPNGSMIIYASRDGPRGMLRAVSVDGQVEQALALQEGDVRDPAWSPFLE